MDSTKFKKSGYELVDWAIKYMETLSKTRLPLPNVEPGWLWRVCPKDAPTKPDTFDRILRDIEPVVLEGMAHWQHRQFFSYFPAGNSWASIMGDIFSNATGANGTTWSSCPVLTELELIVADWCCKFLHLPKFFLSPYSCPGSEGMGIIQHSASEAIFYSMVWAREDALKKLRHKYPNKPRAVLLNMLVAYCNAECHSCVERGSLMGVVHLRKLEPDNEGNIKADTLRRAIEQDMEEGLIPFFHVAIIGSTGITASDDLMEVGPICEEYGIWLHCDAAYSGTSFACPEMTHLMQGFEYVWSTNCNTNKWMMCNFEASLHWIRYSSKAIDPMTGWDDEVYKTTHLPDFKHFSVPSSRRFRAFKLWCVIRNYGVEGIQRYCRNHINLAKLFEKYVKRDDRFEVCGPVRYGLVSFRLKGLNEATSKLLDALNYSRRIHMVPSHFHDKVVIRFALCAEWANEDDIDEAWRIIDQFANVCVRKYEKEKGGDPAMKNLYIKQKHHDQIQSAKKDSKQEEGEKEAEKVFAELDEKMKQKQAAVATGAENAGVDGTWDTGNEDIFRRFDAYLEEHPELTDDNIWHDPNFPTKAKSMLHFSLLQAVAAAASKKGVMFADQGNDDNENDDGGADLNRTQSAIAAKAPSAVASETSVAAPPEEEE